MKTCFIVSGASRGLGFAWVKQLLTAREANEIWALTQHPENRDLLNLSKEYPSLRIIKIDSTPEKISLQLKSALDNYSCRGIINNAGVYLDQGETLEKLTFETLRKSFEVNTLTAIAVCQGAFQALKRYQESATPKIVQISSLMGSIDDNTSGSYYGYRMSKTALNMFNKSLSIDNPSWICTVFHPGWVKTDMGGENAPTSIDESIRGMFSLYKKLTSKDSGKFYDFEGDPVEW